MAGDHPRWKGSGTFDKHLGSGREHVSLLHVFFFPFLVLLLWIIALEFLVRSSLCKIDLNVWEIFVPLAFALGSLLF